MRNIYSLLSNYLNSYETKADLSQQIAKLLQEAILFVPSSDWEDCEEPVAGKFFSSDQVYWHDTTGIFSKYKSELRLMKQTPILLGPVYSDRSAKSVKLKQIFLRDFNVVSTPALADYCELLEHLCLLASTNKTESSRDEVLTDIYSLYEVLVDKCIEESKECNSEQLLESQKVLGFDFDGIKVSSRVKEKLVDLIKFKWIIPTFNNKWLSLVNESPTDLNNGNLNINYNTRPASF
jgi:hypothetical protein